MNSDLKSILEPQEVINWQGVISRKILGFNLILWLVILIAWSVFLFSAPESNTYISYLLFAVLLVSATLKFLTDLNCNTAYSRMMFVYNSYLYNDCSYLTESAIFDNGNIIVY